MWVLMKDGIIIYDPQKRSENFRLVHAFVEKVLDESGNNIGTPGAKKPMISRGPDGL
jgi:hypothetical protein